MEKFFMEGNSLKQAWLPVDGNAAAIAGARISMAKSTRVAIILAMGDSTAAVVTPSLQQHIGAAGASKALAIQNAYYHKAGAATVFTKVEPGAAASSFDVSALFADAEGIMVLEVLQEDLDVNGGYTHISCDLADTTAAKLVSGLYVVTDAELQPAYDQAL